jgi:hypothetical protein
MDKPRIVIAVPAYGCGPSMCQPKLAQMLLNTQHNVYISGILSIELPFIHLARNALVKATRRIPDPKPTHIMFIDYDTAVYPGSIEQLLEARKRVIGAVVYSRRPPYQPVVYHFVPPNKMVNMDFDFPDPESGPFQVVNGGIGMAACLIEMNVFDELEEKFGDQMWFQSPSTKDPDKPLECQEQIMGEDVFFCKRLLEAGIEVWVDPSDMTDHTGYIDVCGALFRENRKARQELKG